MASVIAKVSTSKREDPTAKKKRKNTTSTDFGLSYRIFARQSPTTLLTFTFNQSSFLPDWLFQSCLSSGSWSLQVPTALVARKFDSRAFISLQYRLDTSLQSPSLPTQTYTLLYHLRDANFGYSGLEADQRVLAAHGCYALTATTGLTAQNTLGVQDIFVVPSEFVRKQINAGLEDIGADVVKLGQSHRVSFDIRGSLLIFYQECSLLRRQLMSSLRHYKPTKFRPLCLTQ